MANEKLSVGEGISLGLEMFLYIAGVFVVGGLPIFVGSMLCFQESESAIFFGITSILIGAVISIAGLIGIIYKVITDAVTTALLSTSVSVKIENRRQLEKADNQSMESVDISSKKEKSTGGQEASLSTGDVLESADWSAVTSELKRQNKNLGQFVGEFLEKLVKKDFKRLETYLLTDDLWSELGQEEFEEIRDRIDFSELSLVDKSKKVRENEEEWELILKDYLNSKIHIGLLGDGKSFIVNNFRFRNKAEEN